MTMCCVSFRCVKAVDSRERWVEDLSLLCDRKMLETQRYLESNLMYNSK